MLFRSDEKLLPDTFDASIARRERSEHSISKLRKKEPYDHIDLSSPGFPLFPRDKVLHDFSKDCNECTHPGNDDQYRDGSPIDIRWRDVTISNRRDSYNDEIECVKNRESLHEHHPERTKEEDGEEQEEV